MINKIVKIKSQEGLHARAASLFVRKCSEFKSEIFLEKDEMKVNAKSIMGIIAIEVTEGDDVNIVTEGIDEKIALESVTEYLNNLN